jgi:hypothetical protein
MSYRPITPIKGPGIAAVSELYDEQQDARGSQADAEDRARAADPTRGRRRALIVIGIAVVALLAVAISGVLLPKAAPAATPSAITTLATLAGTAATTTSFDGQRYTITFTAANPTALYATARMFADKHGYTFDTPPDGRVLIDLAGPQGGVALVYVDGAQEANASIRIVVAASDLTADGASLR